MQCPRCGYDLSDRPNWRQWNRRDYRTYSLAESLPAGTEYERRKPERSASLESDALVPVVQSVVSAIVASISGGVTSALTGFWRPLPSGAVSGAAILTLSWLILLRDHRGLLWDVERVTGTDLDHDGSVGPIEVKPDVTRVEITERDQGNTRVRYVDVPLSDSELEKLAQAVLQHDLTFSRRSLNEAGVMESERYAELTDRMLQGDLLRYRGKGKHSGLELSPAGRAFLRQYLR